MRASPSIDVALDRFELWRGAVGLSVLAAVLVIGTWMLLAREQQSLAVLVGVGAVSLASVAAAMSAARVAPARLRLDGGRWQLTRGTAEEPLLLEGELTVAVDLGSWMLLRFVAAEQMRRGRVFWLPAQRRGLEAQWHGLRCAVYSLQSEPAAP